MDVRHLVAWWSGLSPVRPGIVRVGEGWLNDQPSAIDDLDKRILVQILAHAMRLYSILLYKSELFSPSRHL